MTNVLIICANRRNSLLECFRVALKGRGLVFGADSSEDAPGLREADRGFVVPPFTDPDYINHLVGLCREHDVRLLISPHELELPLLARHREDFLAVGTIAVVSSPAVIETCLDKWAAYQLLQECGIDCPKTFRSLQEVQEALDRGEIALPLVVKPRWGSASVGVVFVEDADDLRPTYDFVRRQVARGSLAMASAADPRRAILIQEGIAGQEYGLDVVNDLDGRYAATFVRRKLAMWAGNTERAISVRSDALERLGAIVGRRLGHVGGLDCDVLEADGRLYFLDLNPRFGGGYLFSHLAGANLPGALAAWASGRAPDPSWLQCRPNVRGGRCDRVIFTGGPLA